MCQEGGGISANPRPLLGVFALPMFRFAAQRPRNVLIVPLSGPSRILTVLLRTLLDQLAFFLEQSERLRNCSPGSAFGPRNIPRSGSRGSPPKRSPASRCRPNGIFVLPLVDLAKGRMLIKQYWPKGARFGVGIYFCRTEGERCWCCPLAARLSWTVRNGLSLPDVATTISTSFSSSI